MKHLVETFLMIDKLTSLKILKELIEGRDVFFDEPKLYLYSALSNTSSQYLQKKGFISTSGEIIGTGVSFKSKYLALIKCIGEFIEKLSLVSYKYDSFYSASLSDFKQLGLASILNIKEDNIKDIFLVKGFDLSNNKLIYIPAQLVYLNFKQEKIKLRALSSGAAFGFNHLSTLLRGIYEIIERDAFINFHLLSIKKITNIDITNFDDKLIQTILHKFKQNNLQLYIFDITNDLEIPVYLALIIDRSGKGPAISIGMKSNIDKKIAIIGAIEESLHMRLYTKQLMKKLNYKIPKLKYSQVINQEKRSLFWSKQNMINKIDYLLNIPLQKISINNNQLSNKEELDFLVKQLNPKGYCVYFTDISIPIVKKIKIYVYKIIIPGLQPFYTNELLKDINKDRLRKVAKYYGIKKLRLNLIPHI